jgi:hypothetical protein
MLALSRPARIALVVLVAVVAAAHMLRFTVAVDDAFIAFRSARNWASHGVPEYNPGTREWVPTSLAWVALLAGLDRVLPWSLPVIAQLLGGLCGVATIVLLAVAFPAAGGAGLVAAALCAVSAAWAAWPLSGMETAACALAITAAAAAALRARQPSGARWAWGAGLAAGACALIRPDGVLALPMVLVAVATAREWGRVARVLAGFAVVVMPAAAYLLATFGTVLPVSYYAKVEGLANLSHGLAYLARVAGALHAYAALPFIAAALVARPSRAAAALALAFAAAWSASIAVEGGDFMAYGRFLHPVWPLCVLAAALGLAAIVRAASSVPVRMGALAMGLALGVAWAWPSVRGPDRRSYEAGGVEELARQAIGRYLAAHYPPEAGLAVKPAGIIPFYSGMHAIDFFCLTDLRAARTGTFVPDAWPGHQRMNAARIHDVAPRVVILEARLYPLGSLPPPNVTDPNQGRTWLEDPRAADYEPRQVEVLPGLWMDLFERR